jgi:hypothetical protein
VVIPWIPSYGFDVRADDRAHARIRRSRVEHPHRAVVAPAEQHSGIRRVPLHGLHLVLVQLPKAAQGALLRVSRQVPQLDGTVRAPASEHLSRGAVPREGQDGVNVVRLARSAVFRLFALFLTRTCWFWDVRRRLLGVTEDGVGVNGLEKVDGVDLNLWLHGADGDVISETRSGVVLSVHAFRFDGGRRNWIVEPLEAEGHAAEEQVVVRPQVLRRLIVDEEVELGHILFDNGGHEHVICWQDFIFLALEFVVVLEVCMFIGCIGA